MVQYVVLNKFDNVFCAGELPVLHRNIKRAVGDNFGCGNNELAAGGVCCLRFYKRQQESAKSNNQGS
jgi:hypothetical protein